MTETWQNLHFKGISFDLWSALRETECSFPSNIQLTHCLQDFSYFLTTNNPSLFIFSSIVGTFPLLLWCVSTALITFRFSRTRTFSGTRPKKIEITRPDPTRQNVLPAHPYFIHIIFLKPNEKIYNWAKEWYCDATKFFFILHCLLAQKKMKTKK